MLLLNNLTHEIKSQKQEGLISTQLSQRLRQAVRLADDLWFDNQERMERTVVLTGEPENTPENIALGNVNPFAPGVDKRPCLVLSCKSWAKAVLGMNKGAFTYQDVLIKVRRLNPSWRVVSNQNHALGVVLNYMVKSGIKLSYIRERQGSQAALYATVRWQAQNMQKQLEKTE